MCEFCSFGPNTKHKDRDSNDPFEFGCCFSANAVNEVVRVSKQRSSSEEVEDDEEDLDGT